MACLDTTDRICRDATDAVGHTPLVYLNKVTKGLDAKVAVKLEYMNPACSVKDRPGAYMIEAAERKGFIKPGDVLIEPTSGNMGIGLAYAAAVKGYKLILTMPSSMSLERKTLLKAYGAEVVLTDPSKQVLGALKRAHELQKLIPNSHVLDQFSNPLNTEIHYESTGPEIWRQTRGAVAAVCFGVGSAGTVSGVGRYLRERNPDVRVFAVEPFEASVINGFEHRPHTIPGMGAGFVPDLLGRCHEEALRVRSADAVAMAKRMAREEGILCGISGGANVCAALELAKRPEFAGKLIVTSLASFGERYLSTVLYADVKEEAEKMRETTLDEDREYLNRKWGINI